MDSDDVVQMAETAGWCDRIDMQALGDVEYERVTCREECALVSENGAVMNLPYGSPSSLTRLTDST